jgi:hypothetical protein
LKKLVEEHEPFSELIFKAEFSIGLYLTKLGMAILALSHKPRLDLINLLHHTVCSNSSQDGPETITLLAPRPLSLPVRLLQQRIRAP